MISINTFPICLKNLLKTFILEFRLLSAVKHEGYLHAEMFQCFSLSVKHAHKRFYFLIFHTFFVFMCLFIRRLMLYGKDETLPRREFWVLVGCLVVRMRVWGYEYHHSLKSQDLQQLKQLQTSNFHQWLINDKDL